jgi:hypothetical protein
VSLAGIAMRVSRDLKEVVFVGAFAVICHIGPYRRTRDIDLALATPLSDEEFEGLGYHIFHESGKKVIRTPEGVKLDVYTRDVSGIPVSEVFKTAVMRRGVRRDTGHVPGGFADSKDARITSSGHRGCPNALPATGEGHTLGCRRRAGDTDGIGRTEERGFCVQRIASQGPTCERGACQRPRISRGPLPLEARPFPPR